MKLFLTTITNRNSETIVETMIATTMDEAHKNLVNFCGDAVGNLELWDENDEEDGANETEEESVDRYFRYFGENEYHQIHEVELEFGKTHEMIRDRMEKAIISIKETCDRHGMNFMAEFQKIMIEKL